MSQIKIGIFYDGNYFYHVSNYYCYSHPRHSRLSISGLHDFIKKAVAEKEGVRESLCKIVDCHYFRGRLPALEAQARQKLLNERIFDDILMREGVVTHYLPMGRSSEKGIDVSLALEVLELTIFKKFDVVVLIAGDGDYVPLVRKIHALGTEVMVLGWDFEYTEENGNVRNTISSARLMKEASYPLRMHGIIEETNKSLRTQFNIDSLFVQSANGTSNNSDDEFENADDGDTDAPPDEDIRNNLPLSTNENISPMNQYVPQEQQIAQNSLSDFHTTNRYRGHIGFLKYDSGYGFITDPEQNGIFFIWQDLVNCKFSSLAKNDIVEYSLGTNERGICAKDIVRISSRQNEDATPTDNKNFNPTR